MKKQILLIVLMLLPIVASAYDFKSNGLYFNIISSIEKTVEITYGDESYNVGEITLPSTVTYRNIDFNVTKIGDGAFGSATFDGITIPTSIKSIGYRAFAYSSYYNKPYYICFEGDISIDSEAFWCSWYGTFIFKNSNAPLLVDDSNRGYLYNSSPIMCIPDGSNDNSFLEFAPRGRIVHCDNYSDLSMIKSLALSRFIVDSDGFEFEIASLANPYTAILTAVSKNDAHITLPSSVTYNNYTFNVFGSRENIFSNGNSLMELIIPEGYTSMDGSIGQCALLTKITIPSTIEKLSKTFVNCSNLEQVVSYIQDPFVTDAFNTAVISLFTRLYVPEQSIEKYQTTSTWNEFLSILSFSHLTTHKLIYMVNSVVYKEIEYEYGATITPEPEPTKEGYTFSGWSEIPETMPAYDVIITGSFTINKYKITYIVDGSVFGTQEVEYGATIVPPETDSNGNPISWNSHPTTMPAYDITIYGNYTTTIKAINNVGCKIKYYSLDGQPIVQPHKGINIVKMSDGGVKKVMID